MLSKPTQLFLTIMPLSASNKRALPLLTIRNKMINELYNLTKINSQYSLYSILMFTNAHPHVIKLLKDQEYYKALDEITGPEIALFYTCLIQGYYETPKLPPGRLGFLVPIWKEPSANKKLLSLFDMSDSRELPCIITFLFESGKIHYTKSKIDNQSTQETFNSIDRILKKLGNACRSSNNKLEAIRKAKIEIGILNFKKSFNEFLQIFGIVRSVTGI